MIERVVSMIFGKRQNFFLTLEEEPPKVKLAMAEAINSEKAAETTAAPKTMLTVAVAEPVASEVALQTEACTIQNPPVQPVDQVSAPQQTTAEAIAAELAESEAARPAITFSTYAPDRLMAGSGLPTRRRRPGASMNVFRGLATDLFKI